MILGCVRMTSSEEKQLKRISALLKEAGYDPYAQFYGYLKTGDGSYITRKGDARKKIALVSKESIKEFLAKTAP